MKQSKVILIAGAGPTGLVAALELTRFGVPVRLIDKYSEPPTTSRALAVQSRTMELMQQRGLAGEMLRLGNKGFFTTLYADGKQLGRVDLRDIDSRFNYILLLAQSETERVLRERLTGAGVEVERNTELIAFAQGPRGTGGVHATLRKQDGSLEEIEAAYLIDAEGAHSLVRNSMDLAFDGVALPHSYALADLHADGDLPEDQLSIFVPDSGLIAAFPMGNRRFRVIATEREAAGKDASPPDLEYVQRMWNEGASIPAHFRDMVWSSRFRINSRALKQLRHGNVFFSGDSAHVHSPAGGQGMNTGIQDMVNLGWKLALVYRGLASDALMDTYDEERLPIIRQLVSTTERATDLLNTDSPTVHALVTHSLPIALNLDFIRRKRATIVSELGRNYRNPSLNGGSDGHGTLQAGDRFPDVLLEEAGIMRALDSLDAGRFTLFTTGKSFVTKPAGVLFEDDLFRSHSIDSASEALRKALGHATAVVVRPDGYVLGLGSDGHVSDDLLAWKTKWMS